jgi:hypothetical protein
MMRNLLVCGLVAGVCAGLLAAGFARIVGEPAVDAAIAFEESHAEPAAAPAAPAHQHAAGPLVSRKIQSTVGLLSAALIYGLSLGGLFALAFAFVYGRVGKLSPAATALRLAGASFVVLFLVPFLKFPANPPAVGNPDTITRRTVLYFTMIGISILGAVLAVRVRKLLAQHGPSTALAVGLASYVVVVLVAGLALPGIQEVPKEFPAVTLWEFRQATVGMQFVLWTALGSVFALGARRVMTAREVPSQDLAFALRAGD